MSHELQKAQSRLENIRKVKPILGALRTISLGSWQMGRNRRSGLPHYTQRLLACLPAVLPLVAERRQKPRTRKQAPADAEVVRHVAVLVVGSERGLVGRYNKVLVEHLRDHIEGFGPDVDVRLMALGSKLTRDLTAAELPPYWQRELSITSLPSYSLAYQLVSEWLRAYEAYELDAVDIVYNADAGAGRYQPAVTRLIPPDMPEATIREAAARASDSDAGRYIHVDTDPVRLYIRIVEQWAAIAAYRLLLEAAVTEHAARFQLMESATQNADDLTNELMLMVQSARRQAITQQVQELAIGAGLLKDDAGV